MMNLERFCRQRGKEVVKILPVDAIEICEESRGIAILILNLGCRWI